jgi:acetyltransferase-like isoleucine patch superfamily enzyme
MLKRIVNSITNRYRTFHRKLYKTSILDYHIHPTAKLYNQKNIELHRTALITEFVIVRSPKAKLTVDANSQIGPFTVIFTGEFGVSIGKNVMIAPHCVLASGNHEYRNLKDPMIRAGSFSEGPIIIEDDVWIGANCTITDNVKICKGAIVGANSLVNKNVEPYEIVGGTPIKHISSRLTPKD